MRSKMCDDSKRRILAKVEVPVGKDSILTFAMVHPSMNDSGALNEFMNLNKRQLFNMAKETIRLHGTSLPATMMADKWTEDQINRAREHVALLFPEID